MSSEVTIIADPRKILQGFSILTPNSTSILVPGMYYNDTVISFNFTSTTLELDSFSSIALFGVLTNSTHRDVTAAFGTSGASITVDIDMARSRWYTSPTLPSPFHGFIELTGAKNMGINYMMATATDVTDLSGQTIIVDDMNPEIAWTGSWQNQTDIAFQANFAILPFSQDTGPRVPHDNGTHIGSKIGDSFTFKFAGTSILVSGVSPNARAPEDVLISSQAAITMVFTLDGETFDQHLPADESTLMHRVYFKKDSLSLGNHILTGTITEVIGNGSAFIDYITYKPSFDSLAQKPKFQIDSSRQKHVTAVIVGTIVGGLFLAILSGLGFKYLRKRVRMQQENQTIIHQPDYIVEPFTMPVSESNTTSGKDSMPRRTQTRPTEMWQSTAKGLHILSLDNNNHLSSNHIPDSASHSQDLSREEIHPTESASNVSGSSSTVESRDELAARIREMQVQMGMMTREISRFMVPPAYGSQNGSALGGRQENNDNA